MKRSAGSGHEINLSVRSSDRQSLCVSCRLSLWRAAAAASATATDDSTEQKMSVNNLPTGEVHRKVLCRQTEERGGGGGGRDGHGMEYGDKRATPDWPPRHDCCCCCGCRLGQNQSIQVAFNSIFNHELNPRDPSLSLAQLFLYVIIVI